MALERIGEVSQVSVVEEKDYQRVKAQIKQNISEKKPTLYSIKETSNKDVGKIEQPKRVFKRNHGKRFEHNLESVVQM